MSDLTTVGFLADYARGIFVRQRLNTVCTFHGERYGHSLARVFTLIRAGFGKTRDDADVAFWTGILGESVISVCCRY
jgi:hypothetical protein